jgi:hypothetical protein
MHGLIVADSLGIPNRRVLFRGTNANAAGMPDFKYNDYYSVYESPAPAPARVTGEESVTQLIELVDGIVPPEVAPVQERLIDSFPFATN